MSRTVTGVTELLALGPTDLGHSTWLEIEQKRVDTFADATDDHQWIHVDPERAATGPFGGAIAHGYLTLSLLIPLWSELLTVEGVTMAVNYGLNKVRFPAPVPVGSRVRAMFEVLSVEPVDGGKQITMTATVERDTGEKPVCVAEIVFRYYD
jgi:acyl dehydratase